MTPEPLPPAYVKFMRQNAMNLDCVVASLAMLLGVNYEESLAACVQAYPNVLSHGMTWSEAKAAAKRLGRDVKVLGRGRYDIEEATGLLHVRKQRDSHAVLLWAGRIIEGNGELWLEPEDYLHHYKYQPGSLLVRVA